MLGELKRGGAVSTWGEGAGQRSGSEGTSRALIIGEFKRGGEGMQFRHGAEGPGNVGVGRYLGNFLPRWDLWWKSSYSG
jgi:hypothetical protein